MKVPSLCAIVLDDCFAGSPSVLWMVVWMFCGSSDECFSCIFLHELVKCNCIYIG